MADGEVIGFGFEDGMTSWLPAHVLHEACGFGSYYFSSKKEKLGQRATLNQRNHHHRSKLTGEQLPQPVHHVKSTIGRPKPSHRSRYTNNRASGGPGMQAIFLESGQKSCGGTGVFLPRRAGPDHSHPRQKPACSPVLLPSRVVQALNLNVHALGLQISPQRDPKSKQRVGSETNPWNNNKKNNNEDVTMPDQFKSSNAVSRTHNNTSTDIFLPKEWSY